jgi:DNA-binding FrmR family transcriptional regulator
MPNAIERLREMAYDLCGVDNGTDYEPCRTTFDAVAAVDALHQAAKARLVKGHADTCSYELDDEQHSNGYVCDCGHDPLAAAVRRVEGQA